MIRPFAFAFALVLSGAAHAQVQVDIHLDVPTVRFQAPPPLIVVRPGVQVVEDFDDEVFVVEGRYWMRRGPRWYRARDHRGPWVVVEHRHVPVVVTGLPPGHYKRYKRPHPAKVVKDARHHDRHLDHKHRGDKPRELKGSKKHEAKGHKKHDRHDR